MIPFKLALNASTLFPFALDIPQQLRVAAEAGFAGLEVWMKDVEAYLAAGGTLRALRGEASACGVALVNAIAFFPWADADQATRQAGLEQATREIALLAELGCAAVAAPPYGNVADTTLDGMAEAFAALHERGRQAGVDVYLEFWGRAPRLARLSEALYVAVASGVPDARLLLDPFHMYTGGTATENLRYLRGSTIGIVHVNDYPAHPPRGSIADRERVFPGEGVAPTHELARLLHEAGYEGFLSLELFIEDFGAASALEVARRGRAAMEQAYQVGGAMER